MHSRYRDLHTSPIGLAFLYPFPPNIPNRSTILLIHKTILRNAKNTTSSLPMPLPWQSCEQHTVVKSPPSWGKLTTSSGMQMAPASQAADAGGMAGASDLGWGATFQSPTLYSKKKSHWHSLRTCHREQPTGTYQMQHATQKLQQKETFPSLFLKVNLLPARFRIRLTLVPSFSISVFGGIFTKPLLEEPLGLKWQNNSKGARAGMKRS